MSDKSTTRPSAKKPVIAKAAIREENGRSARNRFVVRGSVGLMKALGIPEDRICTTITNPRTGKPVAPMTLARAFAAELESGATEVHTLVGNFIICAILGKKAGARRCDQKRTGPHDCGDLLRQNQDGLERDGGERAGQQGRQTTLLHGSAGWTQ
jgi:hypothetical protein